MIKTFVVPDRRNMATNLQFHENVIPVPLPFPTDEPIAPLVETTATNQFRNPYKILHANLTMTGSLNAATSKKEIAIGSLPTLTFQPDERITSADKVSQIPIPMKIKSIMKKPMENESKTHLRISASGNNEHPLSEPSDASSYLNLKNVSSSEVVHLSDSRPSDTSVKSKHSEVSLNSPESVRSEMLKNGNASTRKANVERQGIVSNGTTVQTGTVAKQHNVDTKDISALFKKIEIKNHSTHSTSSESSDKRNISTGHKSSSSSDDFWK